MPADSGVLFDFPQQTVKALPDRREIFAAVATATISPKFRVDCGRDSRGYPHQRDSFVVAFATMYSSDEEEALLLLALEDEEISRFVFLSDRCRSCIIFSPVICKTFFQQKEKEVGPRNQFRA